MPFFNPSNGRIVPGNTSPGQGWLPLEEDEDGQFFVVEGNNWRPIREFGVDNRSLRLQLRDQNNAANNLMNELGLGYRAATGDARDLGQQARQMLAEGRSPEEVRSYVNQVRSGQSANPAGMQAYNEDRSGAGVVDYSAPGAIAGQTPDTRGLPGPAVMPPPMSNAGAFGQPGGDSVSGAAQGAQAFTPPAAVQNESPYGAVPMAPHVEPPTYPEGTASVSNGIAYNAAGQELGPVQGYTPPESIGTVESGDVTAPMTIGGITYTPRTEAGGSGASSITGGQAQYDNGVVRSEVANPSYPGGPQGPAPADVFPGGDAANLTPGSYFDPVQGKVVSPGAPSPAPSSPYGPAPVARQSMPVPMVSGLYGGGGVGRGALENFMSFLPRGLGEAAGGRYGPVPMAQSARTMDEGRRRLTGAMGPLVEPPRELEEPGGNEAPPPGWSTQKGQDGINYWVNNKTGQWYNPTNGLGETVEIVNGKAFPTGNFIPMERPSAPRMSTIDLGNGKTDTGYWGDDGRWHSVGESTAPRGGGGGGTTTHVSINATPGASDVNFARAARLDAQAQLDIERSEARSAQAKADLDRANADLAQARAARIPADIAAAEAEVAEKKRQFDITIQNQQAQRAQQQAQFEGNLREQTAARQQQGELSTGYYGGAPTLEREKVVSDAERANLQLMASIGNQAAQVRLREIEQEETARQNERQFGLQQGTLTGYYDGKNTLARDQFGLQREIQTGQLGLDRDRFGLETRKTEWEMAKDPFSATVKAQNLRGGFGPAPMQAGQYGRAPMAEGSERRSLFGSAPMAEQKSPYGAAPMDAKYAGMAPGLKSLFEGGPQESAKSPLPFVSAQGYNKLLPSERRILSAEAQSRGIDSDDYLEESKRLSQTGGVPKVSVKTLMPRVRIA